MLTYILSKYKNELRYVSRDPGDEFMKMMTFQGVHVIYVNAENVTDNVKTLINECVPNMAYFIEEFSFDY